MKNALLVIVTALVVLAALMPLAAQTQTVRIPIIEAREYYMAYLVDAVGIKNELRSPTADDQYLGKVLVVHGVVAHVRKGGPGGAYLELIGLGFFETVTADLQSRELGRAAQLSAGDGVTLVCEGAGPAMLAKCRIAPKGTKF